MKAITMLLVVALLLAGVAASALPVLSAWYTPAQPAAPAISISPELVPPVVVACEPSPCNCPIGC